jgi:hypothetical protein
MFHLVEAVDCISIVKSNEELSLRLCGNSVISAEENVFPCEFVYVMISEGQCIHIWWQ